MSLQLTSQPKSSQRVLQKQHNKNGYFLEDGFNSSEQPIINNDTIELKTQFYQSLNKGQQQCRNDINQTFNSCSFNAAAKLNLSVSPRLLTASTTHRSFTSNNANNLLNSISQTSRFNIVAPNTFLMSPLLSSSKRNLKRLSNDNRQQQIVYSNQSQNQDTDQSANNIYLEDTILMDDSVQKVEEQDEQEEKVLSQSVQLKQMNEMSLTEKSIHQKNKNSNFLLIIEGSDKHEMERTFNPETKKQQMAKLTNQQDYSMHQTHLSQQLSKKLSQQISLSNRNSSPQQIQPLSTYRSAVNETQSNKQTFFLNKTLQRNQYKEFKTDNPVSTRLLDFIKEKVQNKSQQNHVQTQNSQRDVHPHNNMTSIKLIDRQLNQEEGNPEQMTTSYSFSRGRIKSNLLQFKVSTEKQSIIDHISNQFSYFISEYKRVSNMNKLSSNYKAGIQHLYQINSTCTLTILSRLQQSVQNKKSKNSVENAADSIAVDVFISKNPMQIMSVSIACANIYISLKKPIKAIPILKQCKRLSDLYRNQKYKMKCYKGLSEAFLMIRKELVAEKFIKKYLQLSWCIKCEKNELLAYDMLGLLSYYNGDIEKAIFYHNRMANNILEDENSQLKKISFLNQLSKQKRRDERMKDENPPITKKVEGDDNMYIDSSDEETKEVLLVPEPSQQKQNIWNVKQLITTNISIQYIIKLLDLKIIKHNFDIV